MYDLATMDMKNKVIVLMVVGGALMMFSYGVQTKGWLKSENDEKKTVPKNNTSKETKSEKKKSNVINEKISSIDIGNITQVVFTIHTKENIVLESKNIIKIAKLVVNNKGKTTFEPKELTNIYSYIVDNYKTELSIEEYEKILEVMKDFAEFGGEVRFE